MNNLKTILIVLLLNLSWNLSIAQDTQSSKIRESLSKTNVLQSISSWHLEEIKGEDKVELTIDAIEYSEFNTQNIVNGLQLELFVEFGSNTETSSKQNNNYYAYIDESEYPEITLAISSIITDYKKRKKEEKHGSIFYITVDGIKLGYLYNKDNDFAFITLQTKNGEIKGEFSDPDRFYENLRNQLDIATKKLYLPENAEKLKNVKKTNQEAKDVIIDDI